MKHIADIVDRQVRLWEARGRAATDEDLARRGLRYRPVVTVSRQAGSGGERIARLVADKLGFPLFDKEILTYIARRAKVLESMVATIEEGGRNWIEDSIRTMFNDALISHSEYLELLTRAVLAISSQDGAVIVGRGAERILPRPRRLAVRLAAPVDWRAERIGRDEGISLEAAQESARVTDEARRRFILDEFGGDVDDARAYDLVIDASRFGEEGIVGIIEAAYRSL